MDDGERRAQSQGGMIAGRARSPWATVPKVAHAGRCRRRGADDARRGHRHRDRTAASPAARSSLAPAWPCVAGRFGHHRVLRTSAPRRASRCAQGRARRSSRTACQTRGWTRAPSRPPSCAAHARRQRPPPRSGRSRRPPRRHARSPNSASYSAAYASARRPARAPSSSAEGGQAARRRRAGPCRGSCNRMQRGISGEIKAPLDHVEAGLNRAHPTGFPSAGSVVARGGQRRAQGRAGAERARRRAEAEHPAIVLRGRVAAAVARRCRSRFYGSLRLLSRAVPAVTGATASEQGGIADAQIVERPAARAPLGALAGVDGSLIFVPGHAVRSASAPRPRARQPLGRLRAPTARPWRGRSMPACGSLARCDATASSQTRGRSLCRGARGNCPAASAASTCIGPMVGDFDRISGRSIRDTLHERDTFRSCRRRRSHQFLASNCFGALVSLGCRRSL